MTNGQDSLAEAIAGLVNDYSKEERRFGHSPTSRQTPGGRDSLPALVDVEGAHHTGMLAVPQWEGSVVGVEHQQLVDNDVRDQKRALISRIQHRSLARLPSVSVIIPALGCKLWVLECVDAISRQSVFSEEIRNTCDVACEIIVVQDGSVTERNKDLTVQEDALFGEEIQQEAATLPSGLTLRAVELSRNRGRSTARNIGARVATGDFLVFLDCRMLLDVHALGEILIRHALCTDTAVLLGFKQNIADSDYFFHRHRIRDNRLRPAVLDGRSGDWKVQRDLKKEDITSRKQLTWRGRTLMGTANFMRETDWLRSMKGNERIGSRGVGHFLSTALVSCSRRLFVASGGFDEVMQDSWGLEDSLIGARLFKEGGKLIPCPTASAFLLDQPATETDDRRAALRRNADYVREQLALPADDRPLSSLDVAVSSLPIERERTIKGLQFVPAKVKEPVPRGGIEFDHTPGSSELFELYFLALMRRCVVNKKLVFTTETQHLPFIGRTLGQQKSRHEDKLRGAHSEFHFYKLRHRYNMWEMLAKRHQIRILLDNPTLKSYLALHSDNPALTPEHYFGPLDRYVQVCRLLTLSREFPEFLRLARTQVTDSVFNASDRELSYFNRPPTRIVRPGPSDRIGTIRRIGVDGQNRIQARWDEGDKSPAAKQLLVAARDALRDNLFLKKQLPKSPGHLTAMFLDRLGLGRWRCAAVDWAHGTKHGYQDATLGSDGRQCWIVCDGVTPTLAATGKPNPSRSDDVKTFADRLCLRLLGIVAESRSNPLDLVDCLIRANSWVREYNRANGFRYTVPGRLTPFAAAAMIAIADPKGVRWASLGDCVIAMPRESHWRQLNRHQTEDVSTAIEFVHCSTHKDRVEVVAHLRNHRTYRIGRRTFRGFGVLNGDEQAAELIETRTRDAPVFILGSDGIRDALLDKGKTLPRCPTEPDPTAIKTWFESPAVSASSADDKTLLVLIRQG